MATGEYEWVSDFALRHQAMGEERGRCEGARDMVLRLLDTRGIATTPQQRARVAATTDETVLVEWFNRGITAASAAEVFADTAEHRA